MHLNGRTDVLRTDVCREREQNSQTVKLALVGQTVLFTIKWMPKVCAEANVAIRQ